MALLALSDVLATACILCAVYGLSLLHAAAAWLGAALALGFVAVEVGKHEVVKRQAAEQQSSRSPF